MSKYKNKDGISLNNWHDEVSMRWALERTADFLKENFDLDDSRDV